MKYLFLVVYCSCAALTFALRPGHTENCTDLLAHMIDGEGKCINLDYLQNINTTSSGIKYTTAGDETDPSQALEPQNSETDSENHNAPDASSDQADDIDPATNNTEVADGIPSPNQSTNSPTKQNVNTIIIDNNEDFLNAIQHLKAGDRLLVRTGTYQAPVGQEITITAKGKANNWIIIAAYPGEKPSLKGTHWATVRVSGAAYVEIRGFEVIGADPSQNSGGNGIAIGDRSHHIRIMHNTAHAIPGGAIEVSHSDYIHIEGNTIHNSAWGWIPDNPEHSYANSAISFYQLTDAEQSRPGIRNIVRSNRIYNVFNTKPFLHGDSISDGNCFILDDTQHTQSWGAAVQAGFLTPYTGTTLVENNLCMDSGGRGIHSFYSDNLIARNNTLYKNNKTPGIIGELSAVHSGNVQFHNNIIYSDSSTKAIINDKSHDVKIANNLVFGNKNADRGFGNIIRGNPVFVNPTTDLNTADFSLKSDSPAIGTGSPENCAATYFDGTPRNGVCHLGAFPIAR
jgi:parallel beta-helix repeat protein